MTLSKANQALLAATTIFSLAAAVLGLWGQAKFVSRDEYRRDAERNTEAHEQISKVLFDQQRATAVLLDRFDRKSQPN